MFIILSRPPYFNIGYSKAFNISTTENYVLVANEKQWKDANEFCRFELFPEGSRVGSLASIHSKDENEEIKQLMKKIRLDNAWLGLRSPTSFVKKDWYFVDGSYDFKSFDFFEEGQPDPHTEDEQVIEMSLEGWNPSFALFLFFFAYLCYIRQIAENELAETDGFLCNSSVYQTFSSNEQLFQLIN